MIDDHASPFTVGAVVGEVGEQAFTDSLASHLDETEIGDVEHLGPGLVARQRGAERVDDLATVVADLHVDEVDDDDAPDVAKPELLRDLLGGFEVVAVHGLFEVRRADVLARVHIDHCQRFGVLDDQRTATR